MKINLGQRKTGVILSYMNEAIQIITGLVYTPVMLRLLGQSEYGLYQLVYSVISYLSLLKLGFNSAYIRFYSKYKAENNKEEIAKLNGMFMVIFMVISIICLLCGSVLVINIKSVLGGGLSDAELDTARVLMILMVINMAVSFPANVFNCSLIAYERFIFQKGLSVVQGLLNPFLTLPLLIMGYGSIGMVAVTTFLTVSALICNIYYCYRYLNIQFLFRGFRFSLLKEMWFFTFFIFVNQIIDQINWNLDRILLGRMISTTAVAIYGLGAQINTMYMSFSTAISSVFVPEVNRIVMESNDNEKLTEIFTRIGRIQFLVLGLVLTGYVVFGKPFMIFWGGEEYEASYSVALWLIIPETVALIQNIGLEIQRAKNMHKTRSVVYFCIAIMNIFISIYMIGMWGVVGAAMGTAISMVLGTILFMNWYYHNRIGLNIIHFWKQIFKFIPATILCIGFGVILRYFIEISNPFILAICIVLYTLFYGVIMWFMGMNKEEKQMIMGIIKS